MPNKHPVLVLMIFWFGLVTGVLPATDEAIGAADRPNIIIFFTDDQGYNDVGCYGAPRIRTPNLDRLAEEGTRLTSFYVQPVCGVSRALGNYGKPLTANLLAKRWKAAIRVLGSERRRQVSIHGGRHSFAALSFDAGHSLAEVQEALGHKSINTTSIYIHAVDRDVPDVFAA